MRKLLALAGIFSLMIACSDSKTKSSETTVASNDTTGKTSSTPAVVTPSPTEKLLGSFVGAFGDNKITLLIIKAEKDSVLGRSIVGGNDRPFAGTMVLENGFYHVNAVEPGNDKNDGAFDFKISGSDPSVITGSWKPNDPKKSTKEYSLNRKAFSYDPSVGTYPQASQRLLKPADVENMMKEDLEFMRNEIFARHGYCFKKKNLRQQFENEEWYVPDTVDIKNRLTDTEKKNIELIKRYEKYAEEYGDAYGR